MNVLGAANTNSGANPVRRLRIAPAGLVALGLSTAGTGVATAHSGASGTAPFCSDVQAINSGFLDLERAGPNATAIEKLIDDYKRLEREAPGSIKSSIKVMRRLAGRLWQAHPSSPDAAAKDITPQAARKLTTASKKLGTYIQEHCT
jgi:hypothetical protein